MQRVSTGYTMYFNKKYGRTGALLAGTFKSKHIADDRYFKQAVAYILLNPAELFEHGWKEGKGNIKRLKQRLPHYIYSSLPDFNGEVRLQGKILSDLSDYYDKKPSLGHLVREAHAYYREQSPKV